MSGNFGVEGDKPDLSPQDRLRIFQQVERMFKEGTAGISGPIEISYQGMVSLEQMVALMSNQPSVEVNKTHKGDVIWWTDASYYYYYLVEKEKDAFPAQGTLQVNDKNGDVVLQGEQVEIRGVTLGTSIRIGFISKNLLVEFAFQPKVPHANIEEAGKLFQQGVSLEDISYKIYHSGLVQRMGVIQRDRTSK